jgi:hypothetical protein
MEFGAVLCIPGLKCIIKVDKMLVRKATLTRMPELELELIQTHMTQKPVLQVDVGAVSCSRCACAAHKGHARENRGYCDSDSLVIIKKLL